MMPENWWDELAELLIEFRRADIGYPHGDNAMRPPEPSEVRAGCLEGVGLAGDEMIQEFYSHCDGVNLPDVHVGYFIKPLLKLIEVRTQSEPQELLGQWKGRIVTIGSTGGGDMFAVHACGHILLLPPGPMRNGVYDGSRGQVRELSTDFSKFVAALVDDVRAAVRGTQEHAYLA